MEDASKKPFKLKEFVTFPEGPTHRVHIKGGGRLPKVLSRIFTSKGQADKAIEAYLNTRRSYGYRTNR